jgi:CHASE2 domain-containing sensor protein
MMIEWLFTPWLPYYYTAALTAIGVALALRAYTVAREHKRRLLMRALGAIVLIGLCIALGSIYKQFPPLSPLFLAAGLSGCWLLFVLGIERVRGNARGAAYLPRGPEPARAYSKRRAGAARETLRSERRRGLL